MTDVRMTDLIMGDGVMLPGTSSNNAEPCCSDSQGLSSASASIVAGGLSARHGTIDSSKLVEFIDRAFDEDICTGDVTGNSIVPEDAISTATLVLKQPAVIAGLSVFRAVLGRAHERYSSSNTRFVFEVLAQDADAIEQSPACLARMEGNSRAMLAAERTALNLMQRMCGIATLTRRYSQLAAPFAIEILDTRKTTPGLRFLEKMAVKLGGGTNHRFGLYDAILIKDNHRAIAGGVNQAVALARKNSPDLPVEVEVNTLEQLREALALKAERVMLDNMTPEEVKESVALAGGRAYIEVSGGINLENLSDYLIPGVNGISVGALTHSAKNIDISLEFED